jgi:WD40 repeat protein
MAGLAFCPDPDRPLLVASGWHGIEVWDWKARTLLRQLPSDPKGITGHAGSVPCVAFSHDGKWIASGGRDHTVRLWKPATDQAPRTLRGHKAYVQGVAFSPDGTSLVSVGEDRSVRLWELTTGTELANFPGHTGHVFAVAFHADGRRILSGGIESVVKVWDVLLSRPIVYRGHSGWVTGAAFSRDGHFVATECDRWLSMLGEGRTTEELRKLRQEIKVETRIWNPESGEAVQLPAPHGADRDFGPFKRWEGWGEGYVAAPRGTVTSPDGRRVAKVDWADAPNDVRVIDEAGGRAAFTLVGHTHDVTCIAFSPDGRRIATTSLDRTVKLWDAETGFEVLTLRGHNASVKCVAFSPDGHRLVSGSIDGTARVWDARPLRSDTTREGAEP